MTTISSNSPLASYLASGGKAATATTPASQEKPAESTRDPIAELRSLARQMVARSLLDTLRAVSEDERDCVSVLEQIDRLADDPEPTVRAELMERLDTLPEVQRQIVLLHDLEGWRHREIAELLALPEGTVRAHLSYARHKLRAQLVHHRNEA